VVDIPEIVLEKPLLVGGSWELLGMTGLSSPLWGNDRPSFCENFSLFPGID
jgi:hypothetical protein